MSAAGQGIGKLGFGLMRLPKNGEEIDIPHVMKMVDRFMESGFNYFDTAWVYPGSEEAIRQALVDRYPRESYVLATKNAAWIRCESRDDAIAQWETSLKRTNAGYFDYYLLHNLGESRTHFFDDYRLWDFVADKKRQGLIKHVGLSAHASAEELDAILREHPETEFVQLQINWADWESPLIQSRACYEVARKHNKPIIVMEPVKGGLLATPPDKVKEVFTRANPNVSLASWAVRWCASLDGVCTVLSGMSNLDQMNDNLGYMKDFQPMTEQEKAVVTEAQNLMKGIPIIPCTTCDYCAKVCPNDIGISGTFTSMNYYQLFGNKPIALHQMGWLVDMHQRKRANECVKCGACEQACPQHIKIVPELERCVKTLL